MLSPVRAAVAFTEKYGEPVQRNIAIFLFFDRDNPSSVASCITAARENGRIVRTALTTQVWDALNTAFQELRQIERTPRSELELSRLTDWTMRHAAMVRGAIDATLLRNDGYNFLNLGYYLERGDAKEGPRGGKDEVRLTREGGREAGGGPGAEAPAASVPGAYALWRRALRCPLPGTLRARPPRRAS